MYSLSYTRRSVVGFMICVRTADWMPRIRSLISNVGSVNTLMKLSASHHLSTVMCSQQLGREAERLVVEHVLSIANCSASRCLSAVTDLDRGAPVRVALLVAVDVRAADPVGHR
jgi:hypothetical protein